MKYDICVIGSGAGGSPVAYELSNSGKKVVVLEKGGYFNEDSFSKDELAICRRDIYTPSLSDEFHIIYKDGKRYDGREYRWSFWNGSMVGGATNLMSGYFHQMRYEDFKLRSIYGDIEGANVEDWVIDYDDLKPYYQKVAQVVGVSGEGMPYPPLKTNGFVDRFDEACKKFGYKPHKTKRAILSRGTGDRAACYYSGFCGSYPCSSGAKGSARAALLNRSKAKIIPNAFVFRLESDGKRVVRALYYDKNGDIKSINADIFVVAAGPIESVRLLLNSKNRYFKNGLSNGNLQVGKNLIFSAGGVGRGRVRYESLSLKEQNYLMDYGLFFNRSVKDLQEIELDGKIVKGGVIDFLFEHQNIIYRALKDLYDEDGALLWGERLRKKLYKNLKLSRVITFEVFNDWLPTDGCYADIEKGVKDKWGVEVAAIHLDSHPQNLKIGKALSDVAKKLLAEMGCVEIDTDISTVPPPNLVAGGCRFGNDRKKSVLDKNCRSWELDNLFVTDASFMPTGGSVPYTWTIYANSFRVADYIKTTY
jgi:choline dehydrogenase-like flavoprotein